jgi:excisionase family DNA binding protein
MDTKMVYTTGEVANLLHIHQTTVIDWAKKGLVKSYRTPGGHRRIQHDELLNFLDNHHMPIPAELQPRPKSSENPSLLEHRRPRNIALHK